ncbi:CopD family copper resistance protein [Neisseria sp. 23W00296]|uniref:CopD family copper resistance protein n=1 Tax=unclassified Neisseria TaxID=2623750 RepID=UPI0002A1FDDD|nr:MULTISPECIES: hypothetical protein [unclassified Neisseria]ASP16567.1 hypothetical protein CGZ77_01750 [Neisseria sp. KEM232]EKY03176.1 hypothetical protein HMPREF9120_02760 [Neisseria sp. oral taxon 020 str. F0370]
MSAYAWVHIAHLFCAVAFVGGVFFESLVLSVMHTKSVSRESRREVEKALSRRAVKVMPWIVAGVFASGIGMACLRYLPNLADPFAASFNTQLTLKICLALGILLHFVVAVSKMRRGTLTKNWSRYIHAAVLAQMVLIVLLAKTMFYFVW